MMKKLILILTILFSAFNSFSQNPSNPVAWYQMSNAFTVGGRFKVPIDTTANPGGGPRYPFISPGGMIGFKTNSFYGHNGSSWQRFLYESDLLANAGITKTGNIFQLGSATPGVFNSWSGGRYLTGVNPYNGWIQLDSLPIIMNNSFNVNGSGAAPSWVTQSFPSNFFSGKTFNINTPDVTTTTRGITLHNTTIASVYNGTDFLNFRNSSQTPFRSSMIRLQVDFGRTAQTLGAMYFNGGTTPLESPVTMNSNWSLPFNNADSVRRVVLKGWWAHYSASIQRGTSGNNRDSIEHLVDYLSGQGVNFNRQLKTHISFYSDNESMGEQRWSLFSQGAGRKLYSQGQAIFGGDTVATPGFAVNIKGKARLTVADSVGSPMNMLTLNRITGAIEVAAVPSGTSSITTGYGINGDGSGGNPVRVDSAGLRTHIADVARDSLSLIKVGAVYDKTITAGSSSEYSTSAAGTTTVSFGSGGLTLSGTVASPGYVTHNKTSSQNFTLTAKVVINTKGGNADGVGIGIRGTALFGKSLYLKLVLDTSSRTGRIQLISSVSGLIATSSTALSLANGDSVRLTITRDFVNIFATAQKLNTDERVVVSFSANSVSPFSYINGGGLISFAHYGGSYTIRDWKWTINARSGSDYFILGDSNTEFAQEEDPKASWPEILFANRGRTFVNYAQGGNSTVSYVNNGVEAEMRNHKAKNAIVMIGTNDAGLGTMVDFRVFLERTIDSLKDWATTIYLLSPPPRNSVDITPFADTTKAIAARQGVVFIDVFRALKDSSTSNLPAGYDVGDGLHLNYSGHAAIAALIANYIQVNDDAFYNSVAPTKPIGLFNTQTNYFPFIKSQTSLVKSTLRMNGTTVTADNDLTVTGVTTTNTLASVGATFSGSVRLTGNVFNYIRSGTDWGWSSDGTSLGTLHGGTYTQSAGTTWYVGSNRATVGMFLSSSRWLGIATNAPKAQLDANGSFAAKMDTVAKTANYSIANTDHTVQFDATSGNLTASLPNSSAIAGRFYVIIKTDASANTVTLSPAAGQTINGAVNYVLGAQWDVVTIQSRGSSGWVIISKIQN